MQKERNIAERVGSIMASVVILSSFGCNKSQSAKVKVTSPRQPLAIVELKEEIQFEFGPEMNCKLGDMNTLERETVLTHRRQNLLFTVEPILPSQNKSFKPIVHKIDPKEAIKGITTTFRLPKVKKPVHLGLYICKDNENEGHCNGKKPYNLAKMSQILFFQAPYRQNRITRADKPYFFQYMLLTKDHLQVFTDAVDSEYLSKHLAKHFIKTLKGNRGYHKRAMRRALQWQKMLTSKRLTVVKQGNTYRIIAKMPYLDDSRCSFTNFDPDAKPWKPRAYEGDKTKAIRNTLPRLPPQRVMDGKVQSRRDQ